MREIKFRAWDNRNKRMGYFAQGFEWNDEYNLWYLAYENGAEVSDVPCQENINLMQYTGLKDKNGKSIYEGDIVTCVGGYDVPEGNSGCECPHKVLFDEGEWRVECVNGCGGYALYEFDINQIIGNVYENPDLIPNTKTV